MTITYPDRHPIGLHFLFQDGWCHWRESQTMGRHIGLHIPNLDKTNYMICGTKNKSNLNNLKVNNIYLEKMISYCKFLGVWIDYKFSWKKYIVIISNNLSKIIGIFKKISWKLGGNIIAKLYYTLPYPHFLYCNVI